MKHEPPESQNRKRISFIINPIAGGREKSHWPDIIRKNIDGNIFDFDIFFTERPGHATELALQQVKKGISYVVAIGGDGTVNEVAVALRDTPAAMGIIPCGSGNGLARHLRIPLHLQKSLKLLNHHQITRIDYGMVNDRPFFCTFGAGFDAHISKLFAHYGKRGIMSYLIIIAKEFFTYRPTKFNINIDGIHLATEALVVTVANTSQYGNNGFISPSADAADGKLDLCILYPVNKIKGIFLALLLVRKKIHKSASYRMIRGENMLITRENKGNVHLDGDPHVMEKELKIQVIPRGLNVMVRGSKS